eukprot:m.140742 g.140742  ORF g.140742 m.140742 type:complete len:52 (+) comp15968_c0_seq19:201-356(+)
MKSIKDLRSPSFSTLPTSLHTRSTIWLHLELVQGYCCSEALTLPHPYKGEE